LQTNTNKLETCITRFNSSIILYQAFITTFHARITKMITCIAALQIIITSPLAGNSLVLLLKPVI